MSSPEYKAETEEIKKQSAVALDNSEGGEFGGRGEEDANVEADNGKQDAFNGDEALSGDESKGIDTDNALTENNNISADKVDEIGGVGSGADVQGNAGAVNEEDQKNVVNGENEIANGDGMGYKGEEDTIDGFKIIDGKIGGKIPVDDFKNLRQTSIHIPKNIKEVLIMILGKFTDDENSYISKAIANNAMYFDMGKENWTYIQDKYDLSDKEMFEYFNKPAIKDAFNKGIKFVFSHNPLEFTDTFLEQEWIYIKEILDLKDNNLKKKGEFWYVE